MSANDWTGLAKAVFDLIAAWKESPTWGAAGAVAGLAASAFAAFKVPVALLAWNRKRRSDALALAIKAKTHIASFTDEEIAEATAHYVAPDASNVDPTNEDDLRHFAFVREDIFAALDRALDIEGKAFVLVLADSGMGKTTLLLNYFAREIRRRPRRRRALAIVPLGRADALDQVKAVADKRSTLLMLDAFDEDPHAIADAAGRLGQVMQAAADFKSVLVTCRTQFYGSDVEIPIVTGVAKSGPKRAGSCGAHEFKRIYIVPFTSRQVDRYVSSTLPWYRLRRRRAAKAVLRQIPELAVRPMLLALLPDLLGSKAHYRELWDLYAFMVDSWLARESTWVDPERMRRWSQTIAVDLFLNREERGSERMTIAELSGLILTSEESIETWKLTARSLLNRDSSGRYKFAHRSILEYLFVRALVEGDDRCTGVFWTEMMSQLFLSWGRSPSGHSKQGRLRAEKLLSEERLGRTGLFPFVQGDSSADAIGSQWARRAIGDPVYYRDKAGMPGLWRRWTSRVVQRREVVRVYDYAEGLVWQFVKTSSSDEREQRDVFRVNRHQRRATSDDGAAWERPTLREFRALVDTALAHGELLLDTREMYWLSDEDRQHVAGARVRLSNSSEKPADMFPGGWKLLASPEPGISPIARVDVYVAPTLRRYGPGESMDAELRAQSIMTLHGDAQNRFEIDRRAPETGFGAFSLVQETMFSTPQVHMARGR